VTNCWDYTLAVEVHGYALKHNYIPHPEGLRDTAR
jgi:hypothetical protein